MILITSPPVTYLRHCLHNRHTKSLQIRCHFRRSREISTVDRFNPWQTINRFKLRTRDRPFSCWARRKPETATVEIEDDRLRRIARYLLWTTEAVYILWLFLLPYAPVREIPQILKFLILFVRVSIIAIVPKVLAIDLFDYELILSHCQWIVGVFRRFM